MGRRNDISAGERDDIDSLHANIVCNEACLATVAQMAEKLRNADDPLIHPADIQAGKRYLLRCLENMSEYERKNATYDEHVALWARGTLGAARYRTRRTPKASR